MGGPGGGDVMTEFYFSCFASSPHGAAACSANSSNSSRCLVLDIWFSTSSWC